jgi:hypothetical protein
MLMKDTGAGRNPSRVFPSPRGLLLEEPVRGAGTDSRPPPPLTMFVFLCVMHVHDT